ncbi:MAG: ethylbenzene dehydrogenase-related protein [Gammaproteobacteria bacterium]
MNTKAPLTAMTFAIAASLTLLSATAHAVDWSSVQARKITLFYPGQSSWEWLLTQHKGAALIKAGQFCLQCHADTQQDMGQKIIKGEVLEPEPTAGKAGAIELEVKTAYDAEKLYFHLEWQAGNPPADKPYPDFEAMAAVMFDEGIVPEIARAGCWGACHDDLNGMASAEPGKNIDKYLVKSRTKMSRKGGGDNIKPPEELKALADSGFFAEIWQAKLNRGQPAVVSDGHILEKRIDHANPLAAATAVFDDGKWTVEFSRKLKPDAPLYKNIESGKAYTFGFAVHNGYVNGRHHYVSFRNTLRLDDGTADLIARKQ